MQSTSRLTNCASKQTAPHTLTLLCASFCPPLPPSPPTPPTAKTARLKPHLRPRYLGLEHKLVVRPGQQDPSLSCCTAPQLASTQQCAGWTTVHASREASQPLEASLCRPTSSQLHITRAHLQLHQLVGVVGQCRLQTGQQGPPRIPAAGGVLVPTLLDVDHKQLVQGAQGVLAKLVGLPLQVSSTRSGEALHEAEGVPAQLPAAS